MATPPTFVAEYEAASWTTTTTPKTVSVTVANGDVLVVVAATETHNGTVGTPTGGGLTYSLQQSIVVTNYCTMYIWTAPSSSSQTFTLSLSMSGGTYNWGFNCLRFSGSDGVGASNKTNVASGAPSLALTTTGDNSAVVCINSDWNATDGASRTWRTINSITPTSGNGLELTYARNSSAYTTYTAYWNDVGAAGSKTGGISAPSGQKYAIGLVEVKGAAGGATLNGDVSFTVTATITPTGAVDRAASSSPTITANRTVTAAVDRPASLTQTTTATLTSTVALDLPTSATQTTTATVTATAAIDRAAQSAPTFTANRTPTAAVDRPTSAAVSITATVSAAAEIEGSASIDAAVVVTNTVTATLARAVGGDCAVTATAGISAQATVTKSIAAAMTVTVTITVGQVVPGRLAHSLSGPQLASNLTKSQLASGVSNRQLTTDAR